jgi:predicted TIM-barrel fold metal-dependent hydrolase
MRDRIGIDRITFETDYPHSDSTWPESRDVARRLLKGLDQESITKILRTNAIDLFELQGFS